MNKLKFVKSRLSVIYEPFPETRKYIFELEKIFSERFLTPELLPIPDHAPLEIPRIQFKSRHGFSVIKFTPIRIDLDTNYDSVFNNDPVKCFNYIIEKCKNINDALDLIKPKISFAALSVVVQFSNNDYGTNAENIEQLSKKFLPDELRNPTTEELKISATSVVDDTFYLKVGLSSYRIFTITKPLTNPNPRLTELTLTEFGLEKEIEINNRYKYNAGKETNGLNDLDSFISIAKKEIEKTPY